MTNRIGKQKKKKKENENKKSHHIEMGSAIAVGGGGKDTKGARGWSVPLPLSTSHILGAIGPLLSSINPACSVCMFDAR